MAQRRGTQKWDVSIDGNKFKILKGEDNQGYVHSFQHIAVNEQERYSPFGRGNMQSRPDLRGFQQTSWVGGQTWFKPILPNEDGDTYFYSSLFNAWQKPGNLVPMNQLTETENTGLGRSGHILTAFDGSLWTVSDTLISSTTVATEMLTWVAGSDGFRTAANLGGYQNDNLWVHSMLQSSTINFAYILSGPSNGTAAVENSEGAEISYFHPGGTTWVSNYVSSETGPTNASTSATEVLDEVFDANPGSTLLWFDGRLMLYNGDTVQYVTDPGGFTTATDDSLGKDLNWDNTLFDNDGAGGVIIDHGAMNLAVATDRGIFYVKNVRGPGGQPQARIFKVTVTDARSYVREPVGSLPEGILALNCIWHMDSLMIIATPDWGLLSVNDKAQKFPRTQLWHYTQGTIGAVGTFDGNPNPSESPFTFVKAEGTNLYIGSHLRMWTFDSVRGGIHHVWDFPSTAALSNAGFASSAPALNSSGQHIDVWLGGNTELTNKHPVYSDPKTGTWAAKSYTLESNYFNFGVELEDKQLISVTALFEKGSANETYFIDVKADDAAAWTTVATMTCDNGDAPVTTDLTGNNITGNRFQYRIRLQVDSGTNMPEFRGIGFKALSGKTVEVWDLHLDGSEIVNVENEKQDPNVVLQNLKTTGAKNVLIPFIDYYEESDSDQASVDVFVNQAQIVKSDSGEAMFVVRLTKLDQ